MNIAIIFMIILGLLFILAFFTKRRFGVLGLALAAGAVLSNMWSQDLTPIVRNAGLELVAPPLVSVIGAVLVLLPPIVLLFSGPAYKKRWQRFVGSATFALLAFALLLPILGNALVLEGDGRVVYETISRYQVWIITVGLIYAILDVMIIQTKKSKEEK